MLNTLNNELIEGLVKQQRDLNRADKTLETMRNSYNRVSEYMNFDIESLKSLTKRQAQQIVIDLSKKYSNSTIRLTRTYLNELYDFAEIESPFRKVKLPTQKKNSDKDTFDFFTRSQVEQILDRAKNKESKYSSRNFAILKLMFNTGIRKSTLLNLNVTDIDFKSKKLTLTNTKRDEKRVMIVGDEALNAVKEYLLTREDDLEPMFLSSWKRRISTSGIDSILGSIFNDVGLKASPHFTRHTLCSLMAEDKFSLTDIQKRAGHSSIQTSAKYISQAEDRQRDVANSLNL